MISVVVVLCLLACCACWARCCASCFSCCCCFGCCACVSRFDAPSRCSFGQADRHRKRKAGRQPASQAGREQKHRCSRMKTQSWAAEQVRSGLAGGRSAHRVALPHASFQVHAQAGRLNGLVRACGRWKHQCQAQQMPCDRTGPYFVHIVCPFLLRDSTW